MSTTLEHEDQSIIQYRDRVYVFSSQAPLENQSHVVEYYMPATNSWGTIQTNFEHAGAEVTGLFVLDDNRSFWILAKYGDNDYIGEYNPNKNIWVGSFRELWRWGACFVSDGHCIFTIGGILFSSESESVTADVDKVFPGDKM